jgi:hypothetical protein
LNLQSPIRTPLFSMLGRGLITAALVLAAFGAGPAEAAKGDCGQPSSTGTGPTAGDCAAVLRASVSLVACQLCVCDVNNSTSLTASDALLCLRKAVGLAVTLNCPPCQGVTTTTQAPQGSTTSTSTTSTTTTLPVTCSSNSDCNGLPDGHRCNPNNDLCEKPCTRDAQCHDVYSKCNKVTGYCQEPALLF